MKKALITGIAGQDGSYLAELLLAKGYEVHGTVNPATGFRVPWLQSLLADESIYRRRLHLYPVDLENPVVLRPMLADIRPRELYHLGGVTHVGQSFQSAELTCRVNSLGTMRLLDTLRDVAREVRFFHAASSEIFGSPEHSPQDEETPLAPVTPYGCSKAFATQMVRIYRRMHGLFAVNGILFNHESPRRGESFVTRKICRAAAAIKLGQQKELVLGNISAERDWGYAPDYVHGMWLALQHPTPEDYVFATGQLHSVRDVVECAFRELGLDWRQHVRHDPELLRSNDPRNLVGNPAKAMRLLGWKHTKAFAEVIAEMTRVELDRARAAAA